MSKLISLKINLSTTSPKKEEKIDLRKSRWTMTDVILESRNYKTKNQFKIGCRAAYNWAYRNNILDNLYKNALKSWNLEAVTAEATKYSKRSEFKKACRAAYNWAYRNNILDNLYKNALKSWNLEAVTAEAAKYSKRSKFKKENRGAYNWARVNGILESITSHMEESKFSFNKEESAILYYLRLDNGIYKIGITNRSIKERFYGDNHIITVIAEVHYLKGADALKREQEIIEEFKEFKYFGPKILKTGGNTELFTKNILSI